MCKWISGRVESAVVSIMKSVEGHAVVYSGSVESGVIYVGPPSP